MTLSMTSIPNTHVTEQETEKCINTQYLDLGKIVRKGGGTPQVMHFVIVFFFYFCFQRPVITIIFISTRGVVTGTLCILVYLTGGSHTNAHTHFCLSEILTAMACVCRGKKLIVFVVLLFLFEDSIPWALFIKQRCCCTLLGLMFN